MIKSKINPRSAEFQANADRMRSLVRDLREKVDIVAQGGDQAARDKHVARGKLLPRERVHKLLDAGSPFLEVGQLAAWGMYGGDVHSASMITGIGRVSGRECVIVANDATIKGGTYYPMTVKKHLRAQEIAAQNRLPCIYLVDSGGGFLPEQDNVFPDREHFGRIFFNIANMSAAGIPQIACVMGSCTAGGAYVPAMSDESIIVKGQGTIFLGGPPLVKAAIGEIVTPEELGGAEVHTRVSGVADHYALNDAHALSLVRRIVANLNFTKQVSVTTQRTERPSLSRRRNLRRDPRRPAQALRRARSDRARRRRLGARRVQAELRHHAGHRLRAPARLPGGDPRQQRHPVLRVLAQGDALHRARLPARHSAALPAEHHRLHGGQEIRGGRHRQGRRQDGHRGGHRQGAEVHHDHRRLVRRRQLRHVRPRLLAALPLDVAERAHLDHGRRAGGERARHGEAAISPPRKTEEAFKAPIREQYERQGHPYYASARLWDDGVVDPADTRRLLGLAISASLNAPIEDTKFGVFRM